MPFLYQAFGLTLQTCRPIPGLLSATEIEPPVDVFLEFDRDNLFKNYADVLKSLWYESSKDQDGQILRVWRLDGKSFLFHYSDGTRFLIDASGTHVAASWPDSLTVEDMATYLLGPILGFVLRLHGVVCLHASAVAIDNLAVAFLSPSGCGKSTMAAAFAKKGYPVLSDDIVAIADYGKSFQIQPAFPRLQLWPSSVKMLFGHDDALPQITPENPSWDKRFLELGRDDFRFQTSPLRLAAVYTGKDSDGKDVPRLETLSAQEGLLALIANTYSSSLLDKQMRAFEFDVLSRLANAVPVKCLRSRRDFADVNNRLIFEDVLFFGAQADLARP